MHWSPLKRTPRPGRVCLRNEIRQCSSNARDRWSRGKRFSKGLWSGETFVDFENSLNKAINRLRQALADSAEQPTYIETLPRRGYRFVGLIDADTPALKPTEIPHQTAGPEDGMGNGLAKELADSRAAGREDEANQATSLATWSSRLVYGLSGIALALCVLFVANRWQKRDSKQSITSGVLRGAYPPLEHFDGFL